MKNITTSLAESGQFSALLIDYCQQKETLRSFYQHFADLNGLKAQIELKKNFSTEKRKILQTVLQQQYKGLKTSEATQKNIEAITSQNTFTVTTGHQLNIFTGHLYFVYKILTVISVAQKLQQQYPENNFVPIYWMATEDHDIAEINHFSVFGKKYEWQAEQKGAVGKISTKGLEKIVAQLPEAVPIFETAYTQYDNLADATRYIVNELFGKYGIVVIDANTPILKAQFKDVISADVLEQIHESLVEKSNAMLRKLGYKPQAYVRPINFFWLDTQLRERLVQDEKGVYGVLNTHLTWHKDELKHIIETEPERFSPNVLLRPLYQETILPNLAYIGGAAELAYWMQAKILFDHHQIPFPVLVPRQFVQVITKAQARKLEKLGVTPQELLQPEHLLKRHLLEKQADVPFDIRAEKQVIERMFEILQQKAAQIDATLPTWTAAETTKISKEINKIAQKFRKTAEQKHETSIQQLLALKEKLFPNGALQERHDNLLSFYLNYPQFIDDLHRTLDPFCFELNWVELE